MTEEIVPLVPSPEPQITREEQGLLDKVSDPGDVAVVTSRMGEGCWRVTIAGADQPGLLALIAGLFSASGMEILSADIRTLRPISPETKWPGVQEKILDSFEVSGSEDWSETGFWESFRKKLEGLVAEVAKGEIEKARERVIEEISERMRETPRSVERLLPVTVEIDNEASENLTVLRIVSPDTPGFLFSFVNALAMLRMSIERAEIRTVRDEVRDTFWIRDVRGRKVTDERTLRQLRFAGALIKQFTHLLPSSANPAQALRQFRDLVNHVLGRPEWAEDFASLQSHEVMNTIAEMMSVSRFLWEDFLRMQHENLFPLLGDPSRLESGFTREVLAERLERDLQNAKSDEERVSLLNAFKDREMFRIDLRHITQRTDFEEFSGELTDLADVAIREAVSFCHARLVERHGKPMIDGRPSGCAALGLGKYGGREMGFASDVELLIIYEGEGETDGSKPIANSEFYEKMVQAVLRTVITRQEGIFQIDLRLRPYGKQGTLAASLDAMKAYYSPSGPGQQFERLALTKLRPVMGPGELIDAIFRIRDAFTFSEQPLDYGNIRHLRERQANELVERGKINVKYSLGGLVDLEYYIQVKQIERGQTDETIRATGNSMKTLALLENVGTLSPSLAGEIRNTYHFLRQVIDALRAVRGNALDLTLPEPGTSSFRYLVRRMDYRNEADLEKALRENMDFGKRLWDRTGD